MNRKENFMKKIRCTIALLCSICLMITGCKPDKDSALTYNNDIFTEDIYNAVEKIIINENEITNKDDIEKIYSDLACSKLTEKVNDEIIYGHSIIQLVTDSETIKFGLLEDELTINGKVYSTDTNTLETMNSILTDNSKSE